MIHIAPGETQTFTGDTVIGKIGEDATVIVNDGILTIEEEVKHDVTIKIKSAPINNPNIFSPGSSTFIFNGNIHNNFGRSTTIIDGGPNNFIFNQRSVAVIFKKKVGKYVNIECDGNITFKEEVGNHTIIKATNGNIEGTLFGADTVLQTSSGTIRGRTLLGSVSTNSGSIYFDEVNNNANVNANTGNINISTLGARCSATTSTGNITINSKHVTATATTGMGSVTIHQTYTNHPPLLNNSARNSTSNNSTFNDSFNIHTFSSNNAANSSNIIERFHSYIVNNDSGRNAQRYIEREEDILPRSRVILPSQSHNTYICNKQVDEYAELFDNIIPFSIQCETENIAATDIPEEFLDPISQDVINIPVIVQGHAFDLPSILELSKKTANGKMINPLTNLRNEEDLFTLKDVQPNRYLKQQIEAFIEQKKHALQNTTHSKKRKVEDESDSKQELKNNLEQELESENMPESERSQSKKRNKRQ